MGSFVYDERAWLHDARDAQEYEMSKANRRRRASRRQHSRHIAREASEILAELAFAELIAPEDGDEQAPPPVGEAIAITIARRSKG